MGLLLFSDGEVPNSPASLVSPAFAPEAFDHPSSLVASMALMAGAGALLEPPPAWPAVPARTPAVSAVPARVLSAHSFPSPSLAMLADAASSVEPFLSSPGSSWSMIPSELPMDPFAFSPRNRSPNPFGPLFPHSPLPAPLPASGPAFYDEELDIVSFDRPPSHLLDQMDFLHHVSPFPPYAAAADGRLFCFSCWPTTGSKLMFLFCR